MQTQQRHASQIKEKSPLSLSLALPLIIKMLKSMSVFYLFFFNFTALRACGTFNYTRVGTIGVLLYMFNIPTRVVGERTLENQKSTSAANNSY